MVDFKKTKLTFKDAGKSKELAKQGEDKFFKVGLYDCVIKEALLETKGAPSKDPTWRKLKLVLEGSGGKTKFHWIEYPTEHQEYLVDGKDWWFIFLKFQSFAIACGCNEESDVGDFITKFCEQPHNLVGKTVKVKFDYAKGYYAKFVGTKENKEYILMDAKTNKPLSDAKYPSIEACEAHCVQQGLKYSAFPEPVDLLPSDQVVKIATEPKADKPAKKKVELPF